MKGKKIDAFLQFILSNKHLDKTQLDKRDELLIRDFTHRNKQKELKENKAIVSPKEVAKFFSLFSNPSGLKFLIHDFNPDSGMNYSAFVKDVRRVLDSEMSKYRLPKSLWMLINNAILGEKTNGYWLNSYGNMQTEVFCSEKWIDLCTVAHPLRISSLAPIVNTFRDTIRIVKPRLKTIVLKSAMVADKLCISTEKLDRADFYTYVNPLRQALECIFKDMNQHYNYKNVVVSYESFEREDDNEYSLRIIKIVQINSEASNIDDVIKKYEKGYGAFSTISQILDGYCYWSVEALWNGEPKRWNILTDKTEQIENIEKNSIKGFTHILTYYYKM